MPENKRKTKRVFLPSKKPQIDESRVILVPSVDNLLNDTLSVIGFEIARLYKKSQGPTPLDAAEARILQGYIRSLTELSRESRERDKHADVANMEDDDLVKYFLSQKSDPELRKLFQELINRSNHGEDEPTDTE